MQPIRFEGLTPSAPLRSPWRMEVPLAGPRDQVSLVGAPPAEEPPARASLARRVAVGLSLAISFMGTAMPAFAAQPIVISEAMEMETVGGKNRPGKLVDVAQGDPRKGVTLTVHGINGAPDSMQPVIERAAAGGGLVKTFVYDDQFRELEDSSRDLADEIAKWKQDNPGRPLTLEAHSMGGRVTLGALGELKDRGLLDDGAPVTVHLIAPPLGGYGSANSARWAPGFLGKLIGGIAPGRGMGTNSDFQRMLEGMRLPGHVTTTITLADNDALVDSEMPGFKRIAENLRAAMVLVSGADHVSVLQRMEGSPAGPVSVASSEYLLFDGERLPR